MENVSIARARPHPHKRRQIIALAIKDKASDVIEKEILEEVMHSLLDVVKELNLKSFSICQGDVSSVPWSRIRDRIHTILGHTGIIATICKNDIKIPPIEQRQEIIQEHHTSAIGGHKGVTKTYRRIRERYYWPRMKTHI